MNIAVSRHTERPAPAPRNLRDLFWSFNRLTLSGFGGVLPFAQRVLVDEKQWLSHQEFINLLSISQVLPGPNLINLSLMVGQRSFGWRGALAALAGMLAAPLVIVLFIAVGYSTWATVPLMHNALRGMEVVTAGLVIAMALRLAPVLRLARTAPLWAASAFISVGLLRWQLLGVMLALGPLAVLIARFGRRTP
ncbi:MAG: chromate transporter [Burkholderiales bacterium]|nr:chromate transporter [Burkholderiales bacterium]